MEANKLPFIIDELKLKAVIHTAVQNAVKDIIAKSKVERPVLLKEAANFFSMTPHSLMQKHKCGEIKAYRFNGARAPYYFKLSEIASVLEKNQVVTLKDVINDHFNND